MRQFASPEVVQLFRRDGCAHESNISGVTCWRVRGLKTMKPYSTSSRIIFATRRRTALMLRCRRASLRLGKPRSPLARAATNPALRWFNRKAVSLVKRPPEPRVWLIGRRGIEKRLTLPGPIAMSPLKTEPEVLGREVKSPTDLSPSALN
jgi:hypothetical protein